MPRHEDGSLEPLCAVYLGDPAIPSIRAAFESGVRSVTDALHLLEGHVFALRYVRVTDPAGFANLNTPEDWRAITMSEQFRTTSNSGMFIRRLTSRF